MILSKVFHPIETQKHLLFVMTLMLTAFVKLEITLMIILIMRVITMMITVIIIYK